nr:tRNA 2-selenouridine(34) synthase MnmH [Halalkalibacter oceani]
MPSPSVFPLKRKGECRVSNVQIETVTRKQLCYESDLYIDVRSPAEFAEYRLPGAVNLPLFTNEERAKIGTIYKQQSREAAIEAGVAIYAPKWPDFFAKAKELQQQAPDKRMVVYCWRGGMRSKTVAATLALLGIECYQLEGGIRSFRQYVQQSLAEQAEKKRDYLVIAGHTGTRKTEILSRLAEKGYPVVDLEGLAGHRGSVFGHIGLAQKSQKQFEYELMARLQELDDSSYLIIEAESKRIGHIVLPEFIIEGKKRGTRVELVYPFWKRVEHIYNTYQPEQYASEIWEAVEKIKKYLTPQLYKELEALREQADYQKMFATLLEFYYDPRYAHAAKQYPSKAEVLEYSEIDTAVDKLISLIEQWKEQEVAR